MTTSIPGTTATSPYSGSTSPNNSGVPDNGKPSTRFGDGGCTTCLSCPCTCIATLASAVLLAAAGIGLVKFAPQLIAKAKTLVDRISPETFENIKQAFKKTFPNQTNI